MKTILLLASLLVGTLASAQICVIDTQYTLPGLYPSPDSLPCIVKDEPTDITVQFVNFDSTVYNGIKIRIEYLIIDSITNLPCGIRWTTSAQDADTAHRFNNKEKGCIRFYGNTTDAAGQYKLEVYVRAKTNLASTPFPVTASSVGLDAYVRVVNNANDSCPVIDTTTAGRIACTVGISEIASIKQFSFYPNPTNNTATISFTADRANVLTARVVNVYGQEVSRTQLNVVQGTNVEKVDVSNLPPGVYVYTINDGVNMLTNRFVVE